MELDSRVSLGIPARRMVGCERRSGKSTEIEDEDQEQDFAMARHRLPGSPKAVQPKDQPKGKGDDSEDEKRIGKRAVRQQEVADPVADSEPTDDGKAD